MLLPAKFDEFSSDQDICISMAASVRDVCRINPDRGVDLILSVAVQLGVYFVHACSLFLLFS